MVFFNRFTDECITSYMHSLSIVDKNIRPQQDYFNREIYINTSGNFIDYCKSLIKPLLMTISKQLSYDIHFFKKNALEHNLPHTHGNCIFIPYDYFINLSTKQKQKLLVHELVHIYQRCYPLHVNVLLSKYWDLSIYSTRRYFRNVRPLLRCNPDLNDIIYNSSVIFYEEYINYDVTRISDSILRTKQIDNKSRYYDALIDKIQSVKDIHIQIEHPNEVMACLIAEYLVNGVTVDENLNIWMQKYF